MFPRGLEMPVSWARSELSACLVFSELLLPVGMEVKIPVLMPVMIHTLGRLQPGVQEAKPWKRSEMPCSRSTCQPRAPLGQGADDTSRVRDIRHDSDACAAGTRLSTASKS